MTIGPQAMWTNNRDGSRTRIYCKICLMEGRPWLTPEPCSHILADPGQKVEPQTIRDNLKGLAL
jgi:hypothetical protein